jgi:hypothetical protein
MLPEGKHEIKALKQRLVAANARASSAMLVMDSALEIENSMRTMLDVAIRNNENAKKNVERASEHLGDSLKEVREVEEVLKEAEERWEVVDVDAMSPSAASAKRRKVSESLEGVRLTAVAPPTQRKGLVSPSESVHADLQINARVAATAAQSTHCDGAIRGAAGVSNGSAAEINKSKGDNSGVLVAASAKRRKVLKSPEGIQLTAVAAPTQRNGSMSREGVHIDSQINARVAETAAQSTHRDGAIRGAAGVSNGSAAKINKSKGGNSGGLGAVVEGCGLLEVNGVFKHDGKRFNGTPIYTKEGRWKEKNKDYKAKYMICHDTGLWHVVVKRKGQRQVYLYNNPNDRNRDTPPEKGWKVTGEGLLPAPSVRIT